jgi:U4/U6.U5 tri-snRNP component SNU23
VCLGQQQQQQQKRRAAACAQQRSASKKQGGYRANRKTNTMSKKASAAGVDNTARRTWDREEYAERAEKREQEAAQAEETALDARKRKRLERDPLHQGLIVERSALKTRDYQVDLASRVGRAQVIGLNTPLSQQAGYYCSVCDCVLKDSASYLDHINGKYHNRALGMSMAVERSTVEQVKARLAKHKEAKAAAEAAGGAGAHLPDGIDRRLAEAEAAAEREREERKRAKQEAKKAAAVADEEEGGDGGEGEGADPDMMAMMGFGGFGSSKK